jgi:hypothetical protein
MMAVPFAPLLTAIGARGSPWKRWMGAAPPLGAFGELGGGATQAHALAHGPEDSSRIAIVAHVARPADSALKTEDSGCGQRMIRIEGFRG